MTVSLFLLLTNVSVRCPKLNQQAHFTIHLKHPLRKNFLPASRTIDFILWFEKNGHVITGLFFFTARSAEFVDPMQCSGNAQCLGQAMTQTMLNF